MTDGPFKNTNLSARWKRYGKILANEAMCMADRVQQAQKALMEDLVPPAFKALVKDLHLQLDDLQGLLFPSLAIESTIDRHPACQQSETFRKHLLGNLQMQLPVEAAFSSALNSTFESGISQANQRMIVHCIQADEKRQSPTLKANHSETFTGLNPSFFSGAIFGDNAAMTPETPRLQDGPPL